MERSDTSLGRVAQLNRASDYGSEGYRFESCRGHFSQNGYSLFSSSFFLFLLPIFPHGLKDRELVPLLYSLSFFASLLKYHHKVSCSS
ncbi:hypothetical protein PORCAN_598 [Porphyromonas crevioricanis JCM 13913]|nr:hypothetical protein PORCAN_598 [Porphyromonas crevioricanis JCM 13913]